MKNLFQLEFLLFKTSSKTSKLVNDIFLNSRNIDLSICKCILRSVESQLIQMIWQHGIIRAHHEIVKCQGYYVCSSFLLFILVTFFVSSHVVLLESSTLVPLSPFYLIFRLSFLYNERVSSFSINFQFSNQLVVNMSPVISIVKINLIVRETNMVLKPKILK